MFSGRLSKSILGNGGKCQLAAWCNGSHKKNQSRQCKITEICSTSHDIYNIVHPMVYFLLNSYSCVGVCSLWFEGMSSYRSSFSSWKRQKEALTSSHAATRPSVCSGCLTTACFLKSGLRLQRPSSSPVTSVSSLRRTVNS